MGTPSAIARQAAASNPALRWALCTLLGGTAAAVLLWALRDAGGSSPPAEVAAPGPVPAAIAPAVWDAKPAAGPLATAEPGFVLLAVGSSSRSGRDMAVMRIDGGAARRFGVGDAVAAGVRLVGIAPTHVELQRGGRVERVALDRTDVLAGSASMGLRPLRAMRHGADAAGEGMAARHHDVIARPVDAPAPSSTGLDRAIERARRGFP